jgi:hypothetical protein
MTIALTKVAIAAATVACAGLLSFSWCEQDVSLGVSSAHAASRSQSAATKRYYRRQGQELVTAVAAATTSPFNYDDYYCYGDRNAGRFPPGSYYYRSYSGGYCVSNTAVSPFLSRPTLFPRFYGGW